MTSIPLTGRAHSVRTEICNDSVKYIAEDVRIKKKSLSDEN